MVKNPAYSGKTTAYSGKNTAYWVAVGFVFLLFFLVCVHGISNYWQWGHNGFNGASYCQAARNSIRFGILGQAKYHTGLLPPPTEEYFTHHPMMIHFHLIALFKLFGYSEFVGRLIPATYSFLSLGLLFLIVKRYYGRSMALASIIAYVVIPLNSIYANMIDHEQGSIFWSLLMIHTYSRWKENGGWVRFAWMMFVTSVSVQFGWPGYFVALVLVMHAFLTGTRAQTRLWQWQREYTFTLVFSVVVLANFYLFYSFIVSLRGSFSEMEEAFTLRSSSPVGYFDVLLGHTLDLQGVIFIVLVLIWVPSLVFRLVRSQLHYGDLVPVCFLFAQLVQSLLFQQAGFIHAYWTYHAGPALAVGGAAVVLGAARAVPLVFAELAEKIGPWFRASPEAVRSWMRGPALVISFAILVIPLAVQAGYAYSQFWWGLRTGAASYKSGYDDQFLEIQWVQDLTGRFDRSNTDFFLPADSLWRIEWLAYLDAPVVYTSLTYLTDEQLDSERNQVYLYDLDDVQDREVLGRMAETYHTIVYDRRFVAVNMSDPSGELEAYVHVDGEATLFWTWLVNPLHPPLSWVEDTNLMAVRSHFRRSVEIVGEARFGGSGGASAAWDCPTGQVLYGFDVLVDPDWDDVVGRVEPRCRPLPPPSGLTGLAELSSDSLSMPWSSVTGARDDLVRHELVCGDGQAVVGIHGRSGGMVDAMGVFCADVEVAYDGESPESFLLQRGPAERQAASGGSGGGDFSFVCPDESVALGFRGRIGSAADSVGIWCGRINRGFWGVENEESVESSLEDGAEREHQAWGQVTRLEIDSNQTAEAPNRAADGPAEGSTEGANDEPQSELFSRECPDGYAIANMDVYATEVLNRVIERLLPRCRALADESRELEATRFGIDRPRMTSADWRVQQRLACTPEQYAIGVYGRAGSHVDRIGLICGSFRVPAGRNYDAGVELDVVDITRTMGVGGTGGRQFELSCPSGHALVSLGGRVGDALESIWADCAEVDPTLLVSDDLESVGGD